MSQLESWRFSQGLPCKTPLRTHSKQVMVLPSTQPSPKPVNHPYFQMPLLTNENKTQILILLLDVRRVPWLDTMEMTSRSSLGPHLTPGAKVPVLGHQDVGTRWRKRQKELKQDLRDDEKVPLPTLWSQASSYPLFEQEGSAICDLLFELFSQRRVLPF